MSESSSFEDLEVWQRSGKLAVEICLLLRDCRDYGFRGSTAAETERSKEGRQEASAQPTQSRARITVGRRMCWPEFCRPILLAKVAEV